MNKKKEKFGVIIGRFQLDTLHLGHESLIDRVRSLHDNLIIFIGCSPVKNTKKNPLNYQTRKLMFNYDNTEVLPLFDCRTNEEWSEKLDLELSKFGSVDDVILYGSRDSFIPYYSGKYKTEELTSFCEYNATEVRKQIGESPIDNSNFRAGIIYATQNKYPVTYSTVDVCPFLDNQILLGKKPNENKWRLVGGFVDRTDESDEVAAKRELSEEVGDINVGEMTYLMSKQINDWRYRNTEDGIMTRLFVCEYISGTPIANDDIEAVQWFNIDNLDINNEIMEEHKVLVEKVINYIKNK